MLFPIDGIKSKPFVEILILYMACNINDIRLVFRQCLLHMLYRQSRKQRLLFIIASRGNRNDLTFYIIHIDAAPLGRKDASLSDIFRVAYRNTVVTVYDVTYHIVLSGKHLIIEDFAYRLRIVLGLDTESLDISRYRVTASTARKPHKAELS